MLNILQDTAKKTDDTIGNYIASHTDPMSAYIFGLHLPQYQLPEYVSFFNNVKDVSGNYVAFQVTGNMVAIMISALLVFLATQFIKNKKTGKLNKWGHIIEMLVLFVRDDIAIPNLGPKMGKALTPFLCTLFFFILTMNYFGLIPGSSTGSSNIMMTAAMAVCVFILVEYLAIKKLGLKHYFMHMTVGTHFAMWWLMVPIELIGKFTKPFVLAVRLFANMTAGHIVMFALMGLIGLIGSLWVALGAVPMTVFVMFLELLIGFLQAFIFTILTALFVGLAIEGAHDEDEHENLESIT